MLFFVGGRHVEYIIHSKILFHLVYSVVESECCTWIGFHVYSIIKYYIWFLFQRLHSPRTSIHLIPIHTSTKIHSNRRKKECVRVCMHSIEGHAFMYTMCIGIFVVCFNACILHSVHRYRRLVHRIKRYQIY